MKCYILTLPLFLSACSAIQTNNDALEAVFSVAVAIVKSDGTSSRCAQGHVQDRVNCHEIKRAQVESINNSRKKAVVNKYQAVHARQIPLPTF